MGQELSAAVAGLERVIEELSRGTPEDVSARIRAWAFANGVEVRETDRSLTLHFRHARADVSIAFPVVPSPPMPVRPADERSVSELAIELNQGVLRREIDSAVGPEPELAV